MTLNHSTYGNTVTGLTSYIKIFTHTTSRQKTATQRSQEIMSITLNVFPVANDYINELPVPLSAVCYKHQQHTDHGRSNFFVRRTTTVTVGCFAGRTCCTNHGGIPNRPNCSAKFHSMHNLQMRPIWSAVCGPWVVIPVTYKLAASRLLKSCTPTLTTGSTRTC